MTNKKLLNFIVVRVKQLRKERGIGQAKFIIDSGINIARIEQGKRDMTVSTLAAICKYLNITIAEFFEGYQK